MLVTLYASPRGRVATSRALYAAFLLGSSFWFSLIRLSMLRIDETRTAREHSFERCGVSPTAYRSLGSVMTALQGSFYLALGRALIVHRQREPVLAELFSLSFAGIPGDVMTTPRTQEQFVVIRECGCNHC